jgi:hypothetical protein
MWRMPYSPCTAASGSTAMISIRGLYSRSRRLVPISVPEVPIGATRWVIRPWVWRQISGTLVPNGSPNNRHIGSIFRAMVDPELRTANLLPTACGHIVERCRRLGVETLCIDSRLGSRAAQLWQALGFREYGRLPDYARVGATRYEGVYLYQPVDELARRVAAVSTGAARQ